jgi:hypothetical protein
MLWISTIVASAVDAGLVTASLAEPETIGEAAFACCGSWMTENAASLAQCRGKWSDRLRARGVEVRQSPAARRMSRLTGSWVRARVLQNGDRYKKTAMVALARKLLVALWKYVNAGMAGAALTRPSA